MSLGAGNECLGAGGLSAGWLSTGGGTALDDGLLDAGGNAGFGASSAAADGAGVAEALASGRMGGEEATGAGALAASEGGGSGAALPAAEAARASSGACRLGAGFNALIRAAPPMPRTTKAVNVAATIAERLARFTGEGV